MVGQTMELLRYYKKYIIILNSTKIVVKECKSLCR